MERVRSRIASTKALIVLAIAALVAIVALIGCASQTSHSDALSETDSTDIGSLATVPYNVEGRYKDGVAALPSVIDPELDSKNAQVNAPYSYTDRNGFIVQPVPSDEKGWNISYLNADNRGCTSCHTLEDALMSLDTYHGIVFMGYPTEQSFSTCVACHIWANSLQDTLHATHMSSDLFKNEGGTCESCHYIDRDGNFLRWDYEKYGLYHGITDVSADDAKIELSYDQDTLTQVDDMFYKSLKEYGDYDASDWRTDDSALDPDLYENWVFTVDGEVENPISMTLPELEEKFGTTTSILKEQCCINGVGNAMIYNVEVTGVSMKDIIDYVKPKKGVNSVDVETEDTYPDPNHNYHFPYSSANDKDCILVTQINGQTLPNSQGYPASLWVPRSSAALNYKVCTGVTFIETTEDDTATGFFLGGFDDDYKGEVVPADKPNSAVLNYPTGVVLEGVAGQPVDLEGFADAFDEPIEKIEFSWDHGATWTTLKTPDNDSTRWTYWRMKFTPPAEGAYLLDIRTTSKQADGSERVCAFNTQFLLNVK